MHKMKCHQSIQKDKSTHLLSDGTEISMTQGEAKDVSCTSAKRLRLEQDATIREEKQKQQCPACNKYFVELANHKKCPKKAPELTAISQRTRSNTTTQCGTSADDVLTTSPLLTISGTTGEEVDNHHVPKRGRTRKNLLQQKLTEEVDQLKKDLRTVSRKNSTQQDPLYDLSLIHI